MKKYQDVQLLMRLDEIRDATDSVAVKGIVRPIDVHEVIKEK